MFSRRDFLAISASLGAAGLLKTAPVHAAQGVRRFHCCLGSKVIDAQPGLLDIVREAGVTDVWQAAFFYGHWYERPEGLQAARAKVEAKGLGWHIINVPLGHPGDSLGDSTGATPLTPPTRWQMAVKMDGTKYSGTSLHPPGTKENVEAVKALAPLKPDCIFLDDDFRLAVGPGVIGGCFCDWHKKRFLDKSGYSDARWNELLADVKARSLSPILRDWVDFTCDQLTDCFKAQQAAAPNVAIGNMIMYLGAEKAGIRLADYVDAPFRVGELMFNDASFNRVKGKTDELFSALFHRRFAQPDLAYSETTAFPADQLSAKNMAAKLVVSTICDVRNTMFMSGMTPIPNTHWETLAPVMAQQAAFHEELKGHKPQGPFKHYWGEASRYVGDDKPFSLFLASGIPFEVCDTTTTKGWTFLSNQDAKHVNTKKNPSTLICRPNLDGVSDALRPMEESLDAIWKLKREVIAAGIDVPYVRDEKPAVLAWYPSAKKALLWNLAEEPEEFQVQCATKKITVTVGGLDSALLSVG
jgi:hypothetical protein